MMRHLSRAPLLAIIAGLSLSPALAQDDPPPSISVTGEAQISVPPDLAQIDAGVTTEAKTAKDAADANNAAMGKVLLALKSAGLAEKDYQTSRLSLQPQNAQNRATGNALQIVGYHASNRITIKLRDVSKIAGIIDAVTAAGANDIGGINFMVSESSKLLDDARAQALADARRKAEIYAKAADVTLGSPLRIAEGGGNFLPVTYRRAALTSVAANVPIAQGEETLHVAVSVTWAIKAP